MAMSGQVGKFMLLHEVLFGRKVADYMLDELV